MSATHHTVKSPNPAYRSLYVTVDEPNFASNGGDLLPEGTTYDDAGWKTFFGADYRKEFSGWIYTGQSEDTKTGGTLMFAKNLTVAQTNVPYRVITSMGNHRWPPVLLRLDFIPDYNVPISNSTTNGSLVGTVFSPRYYVREEYIPEATEGSRFVISEFMSPVPFLIPRHTVPIATSVSYDFLGIRGGFPECLHPKIDLKDQVTASIAYYSTGSTLLQAGSVTGQLFPATNFESWRPYILSDEQTKEGAVYYRIQKKVYPPAFPDVVTKYS